MRTTRHKAWAAARRSILALTVVSLAATASAATNAAAPKATERAEPVVAAPGTSENRSLALSLLKRHVESRSRLTVFLYTEEVSIETQARGHEPPYDRENGNHREMQEFEARGDGNRLSVRWRTWGSLPSATGSVPADRGPYNSLLWDGKTYFEYTATMYKPGNLVIETRSDASRSLNKVSEMLTPLWSSWISRELSSNALSLSVRSRLEQVGQAQCYVIDAVTRTPQESGDYTVWIDSERGNNIVQVTNSFRYPANFLRAWVSYSMDRVVFKNIEGVWMPAEGYIVRSDLWRRGGSSRRAEHHTLTKVTLKPDARALGAFVPDDIKNGTSVELKPGPGEKDRRNLPLWQDGRVVDRQGRVVYDSGLTKTNSNQAFPDTRR